MRISDWSSDVCSSDLGEGVDQDVADDEDRKGEAEDTEPHDRAVDQGSGAPGRQDAERKGQEDRDNRRGHGEGDGRLDPLHEQFGDGFVREDRDTEIALRDVGQPDVELLVYRTVEPELPAELLDLLLGTLVARAGGGRITGRPMQAADDGDRRGRRPEERRVGT